MIKGGKDRALAAAAAAQSFSAKGILSVPYSTRTIL